MTVVLRPEHLGAVQVQVTLDRGTVDLQLRGAHEQGRTALLAALPDLRRDLESAGLTCARLDVDADTGGSWTAQNGGAGQQQPGDGQDRTPRGDGRPSAWVRTADPREGRPVPTATGTPSSGVDVLA
jgi:flagellar hook-length control protein FliK